MADALPAPTGADGRDADGGDGDGGDAGDGAAGARGPRLEAVWAPRRQRPRVKAVKQDDGRFEDEEVNEEEVMVYVASNATVSVPAQRLCVPEGLRFPGVEQGIWSQLRQLSDFAGRAAVLGSGAFLLYALERFEAAEGQGGAVPDPFHTRPKVRASRRPPCLSAQPRGGERGPLWRSVPPERRSGPRRRPPASPTAVSLPQPNGQNPHPACLPHSPSTQQPSSPRASGLQ